MIKPTYQELAALTAIYGDRVEYPFISLGEEAGEVLGKLAKFVRKNNVTMEEAVKFATHSKGSNLRDDIIKELGDLQWQLAACCTELGITLGELQASNLSKLGGRAIRGTLEGSGDDR